MTAAVMPDVRLDPIDVFGGDAAPRVLADKYSMWPSLARFDELGVAYTVFPSSSEGPLWSGYQMLLSSLDPYGDVGFFHELAHWMVASPDQRLHADYRLGRQVNSVDFGFYASSRQPGVCDLADVDHSGLGWAGEADATVDVSHQEGVAVEAVLLYPALVDGVSFDDVAVDVNSDWWRTAQDFNSTVVNSACIDRRQLEELWDTVVGVLEPGADHGAFMRHLHRCAGGALSVID